MTAKKNLKRRVRARQERTGEPYTVALENVRAAQPPIRVIELISLTESAVRLGLKCDVRAFPELLAQVDPGVLLLRVRDALITADGDRRLRTMRRVALLGEAAPPPESLVFPGGRFIEGARAGQEGPSQDGRLLVLKVDGEGGRGPIMVLVSLWVTPVIKGLPPLALPPRLILSTLNAHHFSLMDLEEAIRRPRVDL